MACASLLSDDDLARFRTKPCRRLKLQGCDFGSSRCQYSHSLYWPRRCPFYLSDHSSIRYVPAICPEVQLGEDCDQVVENRCSRGGGCPFAHSSEERLYHPLFYKTVLCEAFQKGECSKYYCPYVHGLAEGRQLKNYQLPFVYGVEVPSYPNVTIVPASKVSEGRIPRLPVPLSRERRARGEGIDTRSMGSGSEMGEVHMAIQSFEPQSTPGEKLRLLATDVGDKVSVELKESSGWSFARCLEGSQSGKSGWLPSSVLRPLSPRSGPSSVGVNGSTPVSTPTNSQLTDDMRQNGYRLRTPKSYRQAHSCQGGKPLSWASIEGESSWSPKNGERGRRRSTTVTASSYGSTPMMGQSGGPDVCTACGLSPLQKEGLSGADVVTVVDSLVRALEVSSDESYVSLTTSDWDHLEESVHKLMGLALSKRRNARETDTGLTWDTRGLGVPPSSGPESPVSSPTHVPTLTMDGYSFRQEDPLDEDCTACFYNWLLQNGVSSVGSKESSPPRRIDSLDVATRTSRNCYNIDRIESIAGRASFDDEYVGRKNISFGTIIEGISQEDEV